MKPACLSTRAVVGTTTSRPVTRRSCQGCDGFTLVEALVAFVVLAVLTISIQSGVIEAIDGTSRAGSRVGAEMVARTLMTGPIAPGSNGLQPSSGRLDGYNWRISFEQLDLPMAAAARAEPGQGSWLPVLMVVEVGSGRPDIAPLVVKTVRLARLGTR